MKKTLLLILLLVFVAFGVKSQIYTSKTNEISFFSDGPVEDIAASCKSGQILLNTAKNEFAVKVTIKAFDFDKQLMQEHFNEKYMESDKYPYATFTGKIIDPINYSKDGTYKVDVTGKLNMHGVEKERTIPCNVIIKGGEITVDTKFIVALKDHNIEVPSLVAQNVAETVEVTAKMILIPFKQK
ncbi:MAG TPA: YceI family protein [Bacteroidia bacterium]|nr:YceI family protein [Bacteroidia bacterium]